MYLQDFIGLQERRSDLIRKTGEGILYPENASNLIKEELKERKDLTGLLIKTVPHKSWDLCKEELDSVFSFLSQYRAEHLFFLAPLHLGRLISDLNPSYCVYTYEGEGKALENRCIVEDDDVCSEEYSFEIILPYLEKLFPTSKAHAFFAPATETEEEEIILRQIVEEIEKKYPHSIILISDNDGCCSMWKKALIKL